MSVQWEIVPPLLSPVRAMISKVYVGTLWLRPSSVKSTGHCIIELLNLYEMSEKSSKTPIGPSTLEFSSLEYQLQLALSASTARIVAAYAISSPLVNVGFQKRCKDILVLKTWMNVEDLGGVNSEEEVVRRGFQLGPGQSGIRVAVGRLDLPSSGRCPTDGKESTMRKALFCQVGVGRAYVVDKEQIAERTDIPNGYDSFFLKNNEMGDPHGYRCDYYIKDVAQVCSFLFTVQGNEGRQLAVAQIVPLYLVQYEFDPNRERKSREKPKCDNCEDAHATVFCPADSANLCNSCDAQLHTSKLASRHVRTPIGKVRVARLLSCAGVGC